MSEFLTRKEAIIKGENLTPMSRAEAMLKKEDIPVFTRKESLIKEALNNGGSGEIESLNNIRIETGSINGLYVNVSYCAVLNFNIPDSSGMSTSEPRIVPTEPNNTLELLSRDYAVLDGSDGNPLPYAKKTLMLIKPSFTSDPMPEGFGIAVYTHDDSGTSGQLIISTPPLGESAMRVNEQLALEYLDAFNDPFSFSIKKNVSIFIGVITDR